MDADGIFIKTKDKPKSKTTREEHFFFKYLTNNKKNVSISKIIVRKKPECKIW